MVEWHTGVKSINTKIITFWRGLSNSLKSSRNNFCAYVKTCWYIKNIRINTHKIMCLLPSEEKIKEGPPKQMIETCLRLDMWAWLRWQRTTTPNIPIYLSTYLPQRCEKIDFPHRIFVLLEASGCCFSCRLWVKSLGLPWASQSLLKRSFERIKSVQLLNPGQSPKKSIKRCQVLNCGGPPQKKKLEGAYQQWHLFTCTNMPGGASTNKKGVLLPRHPVTH